MTDSIETPKLFPCFNIIHHSGSVDEAMTLDGIKVFRSKEIFVPEWGDVVRCAADPDHFIYEEPTKKAGRPAHMCTCGSMAVIVDKNTHRRFSSLEGKMFLCHTYMMYGKHNTSLPQINYGHSH
jgi:hypothetical protein